MTDRSEQTKPLQLDETDSRILLLLARDARLSARSIARQIGMSPGAVSERISRLEQRGVITGYRGLVNPLALGYTVHALVGVQTSQGPRLAQSLEQLMQVPEVAAVHIVTGQWDLLVELRLRDNAHLLEVVTNKVYAIEGFRHCETLISLLVRAPEEGWLPPELKAREEADARPHAGTAAGGTNARRGGAAGAVRKL
jgi:DNA-binding Lrp family transcriptional regulator